MQSINQHRTEHTQQSKNGNPVCPSLSDFFCRHRQKRRKRKPKPKTLEWAQPVRPPYPPHLFFSFRIDKGNLHVGRCRERERVERALVLDRSCLRDALSKGSSLEQDRAQRSALCHSKKGLVDSGAKAHGSALIQDAGSRPCSRRSCPPGGRGNAQERYRHFVRHQIIPVVKIEVGDSAETTHLCGQQHW